ncbi:hypothetical protein [Aquimarina sp. AU474]|uniref:hypothetical protein n=1 Tax=Aquimarina sp. AU474 TaxID=2108529 RepID=UPI000D699CEA|nr:hypothetical protein [Aquimarina sp. AU474]
MKRILLLVFLCISANNYAQSLSKTKVIYERKDQIVLNNGLQYQILAEKPFYEISDSSIKKHLTIADHVLMLNRILVIRRDNEYKELIEWVEKDTRFYDSRDITEFKSIENYVSDYKKNTRN